MPRSSKWVGKMFRPFYWFRPVILYRLRVNLLQSPWKTRGLATRRGGYGAMDHQSCKDGHSIGLSPERDEIVKNQRENGPRLRIMAPPTAAHGLSDPGQREQVAENKGVHEHQPVAVRMSETF